MVIPNHHSPWAAIETMHDHSLLLEIAPSRERNVFKFKARLNSRESDIAPIWTRASDRPKEAPFEQLNHSLYSQSASSRYKPSSSWRQVLFRELRAQRKTKTVPVGCFGGPLRCDLVGGNCKETRQIIGRSLLRHVSSTLLQTLRRPTVSSGQACHVLASLRSSRHC